MSKSSFVGKYFLTRDTYYGEHGAIPYGYAGKVLSKVGSNCFLIEACREGFKQKVIAAEFFIYTNAHIYDSLDDLRAGVKKQ